ncbi:MAG: hypothetical protein EOP38_25980, partial [Rubrivivax sp.]
MALATLSIDIVARLSKLEQDMGQAARIAEKNSERIQASLNRIAGSAKLVAGSVAGLFTVTELTQFIRGSIDAVDALNDVKDATGASIENISGLEAIALRTGGTLDDVAGILVKFNGVLKEADGKNGVSMALQAIGLNADELRKLDPAEALRLTAVALAGYADDGNKARVVQELFGKSIRDAAPFLNDLATAGKLNATVTTAQAEEAEKFNKQLFALQAVATDASRAIISSLLPTLENVVRQFNDGIKAYGSFTAALVDIGLNVDPTKSINENLTDTASRLRAIREEQEEIGKVKKRYEGVPLFGDYGVSRLKVLAAEQDKLQKRESYLRNQQLAAGGGRGRLSALSPGEPDRPTVSGIPDAPAKARKVAAEKVSEADRYLATLEKQLQKTKELTTVETLLDDIQNKRIDGLSVKSAGVLFDRAAEIDQAKELDDAFEDLYRRLDEQRTAANAAQQEATRYFEAALTPAEKLSAELEHINELYNQGAFGAVGSEDAMNKVARSIEAAKANTDKLTDGAKELADAFKDAVFQGKDLADALLAIAMKRFVFEPLSASIDGLFSSVLGGVGKSAG